MDNAMTGLHDWMMYRKYGFSRACAQLSVDIRMGIVTREAALVILNDLDNRFPWVYAGVQLKLVLEHLGISFDEFNVIEKGFAAK